MSEFFQLGNNFIDISNFGQLRKEDIEKLGDKKLFAIFNAINANGDEVIDASEISLFVNKLKEFDKNSDNNVNSGEFKEFFKANKALFGDEDVKAESVAEIFNLSISNKKAQARAPRELIAEFEKLNRSEDDIKNATIDFISDEFTNGMSVLEDFDEGIISKGYNGIKEFLKSDLAKSNVVRHLYVKNEIAELLRKAQNGELTFSEYYNTQKEYLMDIFPGAENFSDEQKAQLRSYLDGVNEKGINLLVKEALRLPHNDSPYAEERLKEFSEMFEAITVEKNTTTVSKHGELSSFSMNTEYKAHEPYSPPDGERLVTFEEVFSDSYGVSYKPKSFESLEGAKSDYFLTASAYAKADKIHDLLDKQININKANNNYGANPIETKQSMRALEGAIFAALKELGADTPEAQLNLLKELSGNKNLKLKEIKEGELPDLSEPMLQNESGLPMNSYMLTDIAQKFLQKVDENKVRNYPQTPEQAAEYLHNRYVSFFGQEDVNSLVQAFTNDQEASVQNLRTGVELAGGAAAIVGIFCCPPLALAGAAVGAAGGVGIEALNEATKKEFTHERKEELLKELALNTALFATSAGAGRAGMAAKAALVAKNCPRLVASIADIGLDSTISLIADYALTGRISLEGEGLSQIMSIIAGHIKAGKFGKRAISRQDVNPSNNPSFNYTVADLARNNPKLYQDFQLLRSKNLLPKASVVEPVSYNPKNASFSKQFMDDVSTMANAVRNGIKPIDAFVPKFKSVAEASANRKVGETFSVEGTNDVYYMSSKGAQKLDMDRDMYFNLFPPLKSSTTKQGSMGDCYFVSGILDGCMSNPEAKAMLLNKFHQKGNDITIDLGVYDYSVPELSFGQLPTSITFKNAKKHSSYLSNPSITGAKGLQLAEQAYGYKLANETFADVLASKCPPEKQAQLLEEFAGLMINPNQKMSTDLKRLIKDADDYNFIEKLGLNIDGVQALRLKKLGHGGHITTAFKDFFELSDNASKYIDLNEVSKYKNNKDIIIYASSEPTNSALETLKILFGIGESGNNGVIGQHAYRVVDYNDINNTISIVNPWDTSKVVALSRKSFEDIFGERLEILDISKTNKAVQNPHLVSLLKNTEDELSNISPQGRYYANSEMLHMYFKQRMESQGIKYPDYRSLSCYDKELLAELATNPKIKAVQDKFKDWNFKPNVDIIAGSMGKNVDIDALTRAISKAVDNQEIIGTELLGLLLGISKPQEDFIFTLDKAAEIVPKLSEKGYGMFDMRRILAKITCENYHYLKELWE